MSSEKVFIATIVKDQVILVATRDWYGEFKQGSFMDYLRWCYYCGLEGGETTQMEALVETLERLANPHLSPELLFAMITTIQEFDAEFAAAEYGDYDDEECGIPRVKVRNPIIKCITNENGDKTYDVSYPEEEVCHADVIVTQCQEEPKRIFH